MQFLQKIVQDLLSKNQDLSQYHIILPGKRPLVFIKKILMDKAYNGLMPQVSTIEDMIKEIADKQPIQGIALWLFGYEVYRDIDPKEDFGGFLKWFPTLLKDWDDMLKFAEKDIQVLQWMLDEERIKNWGEDLGDEEDNLRKKNLNFWRKMNAFLPLLKQKLNDQNLATSGMIHEAAKASIEKFAKNTTEKYVFCGFNAFTPIEELLVKNLLAWDKAICYFQADKYYIDDTRQEAGKFLRSHIKWKEFNDSRAFTWIEEDFEKPKNINVYEVSGNIVQTKVLPKILDQLEEKDYTKTAVVLLDENLLPASLEAMANVPNLNITMGFPLKNLSFSNAMKKLFYLQKQLEKKSSSYYYADVLPVLEELPNHTKDSEIIKTFIEKIEERNIVYISQKLFKEYLGELSYFHLFAKAINAQDYLDLLIKFCIDLKFTIEDDIQYENISHFEKSFKILKNQLQPYKVAMKLDTLEVLINQLVNAESIDFQGEPLAGLQVMGLLESRLLNFENIIMFSVNEGKLPLGNTQNTYLPFDVRKNFGLNTFLENDSIYAYHFYRLLQDSQNVHLLYNALGSGVNTGEKSRFITQIEMESRHKINHIIIENVSEPILQQPMKITKSEAVLEKLELWKTSVSASHLVSYLYNPIDFYFNNILKTRETNEMEEELSQRNYGNLVHYAIEFLYKDFIGKILKVEDYISIKNRIEDAMVFAIDTLKHQKEFYDRGMNFIHKQIAQRVIESIVTYDEALVKSGKALEIIALEQNIKAEFFLSEDQSNSVTFNGYIDRIDRLDGVVRVIDYKTAKSKNLKLKYKDEDQLQQLFFKEDNKQALQLSIYKYCMQQDEAYKNSELQIGIWSFAEVTNGIKMLDTEDITDKEIQSAIAFLIQDILDPTQDFVEKEAVVFNN